MSGKIANIKTNPLLDKLMQDGGFNPPKTQNWDQLNDLYQTIGGGIVHLVAQAGEAVRALRQLGVSRNPEVVIMIKSVDSDAHKYAEDMVTIRAKHADKTGAVKDPFENTLMISLYEDYVALYERFQANMLPVILNLTEHLSNAAGAQKAKKGLAKLQDPTVVSDIEVKETNQ